MSEFNCPEPGCEYHIGIAGDCVTDQDFETQDYYFQEIEEHERMHEEQKIASGSLLRVQELLSGAKVVVVETGNRTRTVIVNPQEVYLYAVACDRDVPVVFEVCPVVPEHGFVQRDYRIETVFEQDLRLVVEPEAVHPSAGVFERFNVNVEGPVFGELLEDERFQGKQLFIVEFQNNSLPANGVNEFPHDSSLSVGGAVGGTSESTERVQNPGVPEMKKHPAAATAGCDEIKTNR